MRVVLFAWVAILLAGCATTLVQAPEPQAQSTAQPAQATPQHEVQPIKLGPHGSKPLAFYRLLFSPLTVRQLSEDHEDVLEETQFPYKASEEFSLIASKALRAHGYTVLGMESPVFNKNDWDMARYQLGGTVTQLRFEQFETHDEVELTIDWQLFDSVEEAVLYQINTTGYGESTSVSSAALLEAFTGALHNLMASQEFVAQVMRADKQDAQLVRAVDIAPAAFSCDDMPPKAWPRDPDQALASAVTVHGGSSFGGGVVVSSHGHLLTAEHLVTGLEEAEVQLHAGLRLPAQVLRVDKQQDVALLKLPGTGYKCASIRLDDMPPVGSELYAIGTPWSKELAFTVSKGIVSGYRLMNDVRLMQTDASLNPGNSGGPLLDDKGRVAGIVSQRVSEEGSEGLGFGVPIPVVVEVLGMRQR